jgi:hypothetical protein
MKMLNVLYKRAAHISELRTLTKFSHVARDNVITWSYVRAGGLGDGHPG